MASQQIGDGAAWSVTQSYAYDKLNRLQSAAEGVSGPGWKYTFGYDAWGNGWVDTTPTESYGLLTDGNRPNAGSWFTAKNRLNLGTNSYDLAGNQKQFNPWTLGHDAENRMVQAAKTGLTETYAYDGEGRRVKKVSGDLTTYYVYTADGELAAEYEVGSGGGSMPCTTCYLFADHLGSTRAVWDSNGVKARYDWAPFGEAVAADRNGRTGVLCGGASCFGMTGPLKQKFTGKERDAETGLDYFGARYMASAQGRFTSPDPLLNSGRPWEPQSWNRYAYTLNNPLRYTDPTGLYEWDASLGGSCADKALRSGGCSGFT